jgi:hypothetical protein
VKPPPGVDLVDKIAVAFDQRERQQAQRPDFMETAMMMLQIQSQHCGAGRAGYAQGQTQG